MLQVDPGDEVILIEPYFNFYKSLVTVAQGVPVFVSLRPSVDPPTKSSHWIFDPKELESKFNKNTKLMVLNTPNNPLGKVCTL